MARKRTRRTDSDAPYELVDDERDDAQDSRRSRSSRRTREPRKKSWLRRIFFLLLLVGATIALLPTIVTKTPLRNTLLSWAGNTLGLELEADQLAGGWMTTPSATNLVVRDKQGLPLLEAEHVSIDRTLVQLLQNQKDLGNIQLNKPIAHVSIREDGSNWQDALQPLLEGESSSGTPKLQVNITDGHVHIQDDRQLRSWDVAPLQLTATIDEHLETPLQAQMTANITDGNGQAGAIKLTVAGGDLQASSLQADIDTRQMPLVMLQPILSASGTGVQVSGNVDLRSNVKWISGPNPRAHITLHAMDIRKFVATSDQLPVGDTLQMEQLTGAGDLRWEEGILLANNLELQSDVASVTANGRLRLAHLVGPQGLQLTTEDELNLAAQVDVARLAGMMPTTLHIREDTRIDSGLLKATLDSRVEQGLRVWHGVLTTSQLAATTGGRTVQWDEPVSVELDAAQNQGNWSVRKLNCLSSFLTLTGNGQANGGQINLEGNLDQLRKELSQFVNLGNIGMAGISKGAIKWRQGPAGMEADGELNLTQFQLALPNRAPLTEQQLRLVFSGRGQMSTAGSITQVDQAKLTVQAAGDTMSLNLLQPVTTNSTAAYPVRLQVGGDLGRWVMRAAVLSGQPHLKGDGNIDFDGTLAVATSHISISRSRLNATPCRITGIGVPIDEPQLTAEIIGAYDVPSKRWSGGDSNVVSATFAARCNNLLIAPQTISGDIACRGNLERIMRLIGAERADQRLQGEFSGSVRLVQQDGATQFAIKQRLQNFTALHRDTTQLRTVSNTSPWRTSWAEPFIDIDTAGVLQPGMNNLQFERLVLGLESAQVAVNGQLADLAGRLQADLKGNLSYDLQRLTKKLQPITGNSILLEGVSEKPISIRGPLRSAPLDPQLVGTTAQPLLPMDLTASAGFQWDAASIEGFRVGAGQINTLLDQATVRFDGMQIPVSQGKILLAPQVSFRTASPILTLPPGPVVENLLISKEMTATWMKYVAPMLADATRVNGTFSASVDQVNVPLTHPTTGTMRGKLTIHSAQAGPGPLAEQLLMLVNQADNLVRGAGEGASKIDLNRALSLLNNGGLTNQQGGLDPKKAFSNFLTGNTPPAGAAPNSNAVWLQVPEHEVNFHVAEGRVHHENMRVLVDNIEVRTTGSVGFDETLNLMAEMAIPEKWIGNNPRLASLKGQVLRIPVGGTARQPRLDKTAFRHLAGQLFNNAASGVVGNALGGSLFGTGPAGQGGIPNMTPTGINPAPGTPAPGTAPQQPGAATPGTIPPTPPANNPIQNGINGAAGNVQREVDRAFNKLFGR